MKKKEIVFIEIKEVVLLVILALLFANHLVNHEKVVVLDKKESYINKCKNTILNNQLTCNDVEYVIVGKSRRTGDDTEVSVKKSIFEKAEKGDIIKGKIR